MTSVNARFCKIESLDGVWGYVEHCIELILVGLSLGLSNLSIDAFDLAVWWTKGLDPRVVVAMGLTAVTHFWWCILGKGEGSEKGQRRLLMLES